MRATADSVEVTWSLIAFGGVVLGLIAVSLAWKDCRSARRFGDLEFIDQAWHNARREMLRVIGQFCNLLPGLVSMFAPATGVPSDRRMVLVLFLSAGSAMVTLNTGWDVWHRYQRRRRRRIADAASRSEGA